MVVRLCLQAGSTQLFWQKAFSTPWRQIWQSAVIFWVCCNSKFKLQITQVQILVAKVPIWVDGQRVVSGLSWSIGSILTHGRVGVSAWCSAVHTSILFISNYLLSFEHLRTWTRNWFNAAVSWCGGSALAWDSNANVEIRLVYLHLHTNAHKNSSKLGATTVEG